MILFSMPNGSSENLIIMVRDSYLCVWNKYYNLPCRRSFLFGSALYDDFVTE